MRELVLGGVRSGKSRYAEQMAKDLGGELLYLATAEPLDSEMEARIANHQQQRGAAWRLVEEPIHLADMLAQEAREGRTILVECLTLWLTNLLMREDEALFSRQRSALLTLLPKLSGEILLVSNETGLGIVPMDPLSRRFCDEAGWLHQELAQICERVTWVVAGLPQAIKRSE